MLTPAAEYRDSEERSQMQHRGQYQGQPQSSYGQDSFAQPSAFGGQNSYAQPSAFGGQDSYAQQRVFGGQDSYAQQRVFGGQDSYAQQSYGSQGFGHQAVAVEMQGFGSAPTNQYGQQTFQGATDYSRPSYAYGEVAPTLIDVLETTGNDLKKYFGRRALILCGVLAAVFFTLFVISESGIFNITMIDEFITLGALLDIAGFGILGFRVFASQCGAGISVHMLFLYLGQYMFRFLSISIQATHCYTPEHHLGEFYHWILLVTAVMVLGVLYLMSSVRRDSKVDIVVSWPFFIAAFLLAAATHIECAGWWADVLFCASHWLDAFALLPQMYLVETRGFLERTTSYFMAALIASRYLSFFSWALVIMENQLLMTWISFTMLVSYSIVIMASKKFVYFFFTTIDQPTMKMTDEYQV